MHTYEKTFLTYQEALDFKKKLNSKGVKIDSFLSLNEKGKVITVYRVTYKQIF